MIYFNNVKHAYHLSSGKVFHSHHGVLGVDPITGTVWEGGSRIVNTGQFTQDEKNEVLAAVVTQWLSWAGVSQDQLLEVLRGKT